VIVVPDTSIKILLSASQIEKMQIVHFGKKFSCYFFIFRYTENIGRRNGFSLFKFLKGMTPNGDVVPAQRFGDNR